MAFPRSARQYALITDAATGTANLAGLEQFSHKLTKKATTLQSHLHLGSSKITKNYSQFLLEAAAVVWGMDVFNECLIGKQFVLFTDHKPLEKLGHLHTKILN
jgi:hypothetical protein